MSDKVSDMTSDWYHIACMHMVALQFVEDQGAWPVRTRLLYFIGGCAEEGSHGKRMRRLLVKLMQQHAMFHPSDDLFVHCNGEENLPTQVCVKMLQFMKATFLGTVKT